MQVLAKEIVHSRKAVSRLYVNKAQLISLGHALTEQLGEHGKQRCLACSLHGVCMGYPLTEQLDPLTEQLDEQKQQCSSGMPSAWGNQLGACKDRAAV